MWSRIFAKGVVFLILHSLTLLILYVVSRLCKVTVNKKTYLWLLCIHLVILIFCVTVLL